MAVIMAIIMMMMLFMVVIMMNFMVVFMITLKVTLQSMSSKGILGLSGLTNGGKIKVVYFDSELHQMCDCLYLRVFK